MVAFTELESGLRKFEQSANLHPQVPQLIKAWDRDIMIEPLDGDGKVQVVQVRSGKLQLIVAAPENEITSPSLSPSLATYPQILLKGTLAHLAQIFSGEISPAEAYFNGDLECYASDQDQVKLDAISLLLWGV